MAGAASILFPLSTQTLFLEEIRVWTTQYSNVFWARSTLDSKKEKKKKHNYLKVQKILKLSMHLSNTLSVCFEDIEKTDSQVIEKSNANYNKGHHF